MGILRKLPAGMGAKVAPEEAADLPAFAMMELPGTAAASNPPEDAARNCRRSMDGSLADEFWCDEPTTDKSLGRDVMRVTSANVAPQTDTFVLRHYTTCDA